MEQTLSSPDLLAIIRTGLWGDANEVEDAEVAIGLLAAKLDQLEAEVRRWRG
jgi:hypothetical protein